MTCCVAGIEKFLPFVLNLPLICSELRK